MTGASRGIFLSTVIRRVAPCREHFVLTLGVDGFPACHPGQFVQVLCRDSNAVMPGAAMLRRPFSIGGLRRSTNQVEMEIVGRVVGPGTAWLDGRRAGDVVDILGPLGRAFSPPKKEETALLVAGGVGLPPIRWLCEILHEISISCEFSFGAQRADLIPFELAAAPARDGVPTPCAASSAGIPCPLSVSTDDGSIGLRGRVTDALQTRINRAGAKEKLRVYACGPEPMLHAVAGLCAARAIECEVALERVMGCGIGTCQSCVVPMRDEKAGRKYLLCCRDGPVFDATKVAWDLH